MDLYLPIAEVSVNAPLVIALAAAVGFVSAALGVGGGLLMVPVLMFLGVPPAVAVATEASHVAATSTAGVIAFTRRRAVDFRMGGVLAAGGAVGAVIGVELFRRLRLAGQADLVVSLAYFLFLSVVGGLMLAESLTAILRRRRGEPAAPRRDLRPLWLFGLPLRLRFPQSRLYISVIPPLALGAIAGVLSATMGIGGGFLLVPALAYWLRMPAGLVVGASLLPIIVTTALATVLHAGRNQTVDLALALLLLAGGVLGAQLGAQAAARVRSEELRALLAVVVLVVGLKMGLDLFVRPEEPFVLLAGAG
ncbi:MAG: sulfite exporter TauE/SafE family protein [Phenylobacterium sp.]